MAARHEFQPITSAESLQAAIHYVSEQSQRLAETVLGRVYDINTVCLFAHSDEEYHALERHIEPLGSRSSLSHDRTTYIGVELDAAGQFVSLLGFRRPDDTRPQVGYADYTGLNYAEILRTQVDNEYVQQIERADLPSLIELRHPDFDVLGYIVKHDADTA